MTNLQILNSVPIRNFEAEGSSKFDPSLGLSVVGSFEMVAMSYDTVGFSGHVYAQDSIPNAPMVLLENHDQNRQVGVMQTRNDDFEGRRVAMGYGAFHDTNEGRDAFAKARNNNSLGIQETSTGLYILDSAVGNDIPASYREQGAVELVRNTEVFETSLVLRGNIPGTKTTKVNQAPAPSDRIAIFRANFLQLLEDIKRDNDVVAVNALSSFLQEQTAPVDRLLEQFKRPADQGSEPQGNGLPPEIIRALVEGAESSVVLRTQLKEIE